MNIVFPAKPGLLLHVSVKTFSFTNSGKARQAKQKV